MELSNELREAEIRMRKRISQLGYLPPVPGQPKRPDNLLECYSREERLRMAYVPVVVTGCIWEYVGRVVEYCINNRIDEVKKLTRAVKTMREDYYAFLRGSIDADHLTRAKECTETFRHDFARDMQIMWFTINGELKKRYPNMRYDTMRTDALCAILLVRLVKRFCAEVDKDILLRTGAQAHTMNPKVKNLDSVMDAYVGDYEIDRTELIQRCEIILRKAIDTITYTEPK